MLHVAIIYMCGILGNNPFDKLMILSVTEGEKMQLYPLNGLKKMFTFVLTSRLSPFYRDLYKKNSVKVHNIKTVSDFMLLPFLTREDILSVDPLSRLFVPKEEVTQWDLSSGTTSSNIPLVIPKMDHWTDDLNDNEMARKLKARDVKTVLLLTSMNKMNGKLREWISHPKLSKTTLIFGDISDLNTAAKLSAASSIEAIATTSSALFFFLPFLKEVYALKNIKFISLGGETTSVQKLKFFKSYFKNAHFHFRFGGTENPVAKGFQCFFLSNLAPRYLHPNTDFFLYEALDQDGNPVKKGNAGELVLTTLKKCAFPLLRYKTGDVILWSDKKCACGRKDVFALLGRMGYDFIRVSGITIYTQMLDQAVASALGAFDDQYQLHIYEVINNNKLMPKLVFDIDKKYKKVKDIGKKIEENLMVSPRLNLKKLVDQEIFLPLEIKFVSTEERKLKKLKIISYLS